MILPKAPLRLHPAVAGGAFLRAAILAVVGAAILLGGFLWEGRNALHLIREGEIWEHGVQSLQGEVKGTVRSRRLFLVYYTLNVRYQDLDDEWHEAELGFSTLGAHAGTELEPIVKYDENDPSRFALSWAQDVRGSRWGSIVLGFLLAGFIGLFFLRSARKKLEGLGDLRACTRAFDACWRCARRAAPSAW
jgi:hypothetical protein